MRTTQYPPSLRNLLAGRVPRIVVVSLFISRETHHNGKPDIRDIANE